MADDADLLRRAPDEPEALGRFYDRHERAVLAYFVRRARDPEVAAELTAETFAQVVAACRRREEIREPVAWLFTIAHSTLVDWVRRGAVADRARRKLAMGRLAVDDAALARIDALGGEDVAGALAELSADERDAVLARVIEDRSYADIAARQATTETAARKRVSRALARMRRRMEGGTL